MSAPQGPPVPQQPSSPPSSQPSSQPPSQQPPSQQPPSSTSYGPPAYAGSTRPARVTEGPEIGLPPGVAIADLGPRLLAWVVDASVPIVLSLLRLIIGAARGQDAPAAVVAIFAVLSIGWFVFVWWGYATKAAGPGARAAQLQLVGMEDGRPIGWGRYLIRSLIFGVASVFFPVLIGLLIIMVRHPRRQGWHDLAVGSVVIKARPLAPRPTGAGSSEQRNPAVDQASAAEPTVGIPASYGTPPAGTPGYGTPPATYGGSQPAPYDAPSTPPHGSAQGPAGYGAAPTGTPAGPLPSAGPAAHYGPVNRFGSPSSATPSAPPPGVGEDEPGRTSGAARAQEDDAVDAAPPSAAPVTAGPTEDRRPVAVPPPPTTAPAPGPQPASEPQPAPDAPRPTSVAGAGRWRLELDGRAIVVDRLILLGRNPQRGPGEEDAELVKVKDEARTVSKTHVAIGVDDQGLFVVDRGSTNGSAVTDPDGVYRLLRADERIRIDTGWTVAFGSHEVKVTGTD